MKTFVIRCNDSVEAVVIGDEQFARQEMERRRAAYFELNKWDFRGDEKAYRARCYWRVHEYDAVVQLGFYGDDGTAERINHVHQFTPALIADPKACAIMLEQIVRPDLLKGGPVLIKVVKP